MKFAYPRSTGASSLPSYNQHQSSRSQNILSRVWDCIPSTARQWLTESVSRRIGSIRSEGIKPTAINLVKRIFTISNVIILLWMFSIRWGERTVFEDSINKCLWDSWEEWPQGATPHHIAFIADPQLVDPHTYPGRPWPVSTLTVKYTDQYMRRSFSLIQDHLEPDSVLFLGDLFDGGREWATATTSSPEPRWKKYTDSFWKKEFGRFIKIFVDPWEKFAKPPVDGRGRRMIASLPGNHDLGFGNGIQEPVRDRFESFFGNPNRVDVIGNHTFVSVDSPSLSAMDQPDPLTGSSPTASENHSLRPIWKDADDFLDKMAIHKAKAETDELRMLQNKTEEHTIFDYRIADAVEPAIHQKPQPAGVGFPTIILTHVPLYREPATPCGPLREHYPPSSSDEELTEDEPNSLRIAGGYQYQNVLTQTISTELVSKAGPNVVQVYSGDDHDYCEVSHREFNGSPNEITVKSISWAMGVRHPGFVLTSLWNPIDPKTGKSIQDGSPPTVQNHLCILPDQLGIFIYYLIILCISVSILLLRSIYRVLYTPEPCPSGAILPLSEPRSLPHHHTSGASSSTLSSAGGLASRNGMTASTRYPGTKSPEDAYRGIDGDFGAASKDKAAWRPASATRSHSTVSLIVRDLYHSLKFVAQVVMTVYFILIWRW
ncbi:hypothetical protein DTO013E5_5698 [Penicillium roqueforti]|uniref:Metallophosphoesterase domain n=1 Tax=Penicillium roqueforti (strain FM164) TaxID=1365484 RepID=W6Q8X0_PENRF|nr:uncharacterized protein LCP9604111_7960 [Penicillium roqueforti]CDM33113.1 Metallophosphoesterase domain [Penicillium roqueforti FM164]KAF9242777.1 hypothetical protein LCP9604111_7960 [Penicillium roqueforti]KAI1830517.1 hypothetical protein CBS147337_8583 [Penicillium roqueforti]KAI2674399.1 hypothetical protein CBS147355_7013 [Penicillium roqueforti]KAI2683944.1 hypothetical protein LCP963914a_5774 [Penicillium roqueforti]